MARTSKHSGPKFANGNYKSYQKEYDSSQLQINKRKKLNAKNREAGTYGNRDKKDVAHTRSGKTRLQAQSINRAANGHGKRSRYS